jgi:hypothetical protein
VRPEECLVDAAGVGWVVATDPALFGAVLRLRILELDRTGIEAPIGFATWFAFRAALDAGGGEALARLARVVRQGPPWAAERAGELLADRETADAAVHLAQIALEAPSEARSRAYQALAQGRVPLDRARPLLARALAREARELRARAFAAFVRGATDKDLARLRHDGPGDVRAHAFLALVERWVERARGNDRPKDLVREALADGAAEVRRAAVQVLSGREWDRDPRAQSWLIGRLVDQDRAVRVEAARLLRRRGVDARVAPRLRTLAEEAPPGLRPPIERLADRAER